MMDAIFRVPTVALHMVSARVDLSRGGNNGGEGAHITHSWRCGLSAIGSMCMLMSGGVAGVAGVGPRHSSLCMGSSMSALALQDPITYFRPTPLMSWSPRTLPRAHARPRFACVVVLRLSVVASSCCIDVTGPCATNGAGGDDLACPLGGQTVRCLASASFLTPCWTSKLVTSRHACA